MKKFKYLPAIAFVAIIFLSPSAFAVIDFDIGAGVSYSAPKNEVITKIKTESKAETEIKYEDKTASTTAFIVRSKLSVSAVRIGLGILTATEDHTLTDANKTVEYHYIFDTLAAELLFAVPFQYIEVGLSVGGGTKEYKFGKIKTAKNSKEVKKSVSIAVYGGYLVFPLRFSKNFALRFGLTYQGVSGGEEKVLLNEAFGISETTEKIEHTIKPDAGIVGLTIGAEF